MLEEKVLKTLQKYDLIENGNNIVIGVSGGPDSMALLNVLYSLKKKKQIEVNIVVAHVNHGIRKEAEEETKYVEQFCKEREISCFIKREKVEELAKKQKIGTEEAGRKLRYEFFEEVAQKFNNVKIATAHNANDNSETVLMNLIRGSGLTGLKGIEVKRGKYIRPLIECEREEIEQYCKEEKLEPKYDKSNEENIYTRNKIRNILLPLLKKEFNPNIVTSLNRMSQIIKEENEYIQKQVEEIYKQVCIQEYTKQYENNITEHHTEENLSKNSKENAKENLNKTNEENAKENLNKINKEDTKKFLGNEEIQQNIQEKNQIELDLKKFNAQEKVIKNRLVLYTINKLLGTSQNIEMVHIADIIQLCENNIGNKYLTPNKKVKILVNKGKIFFQKIN